MVILKSQQTKQTDLSGFHYFYAEGFGWTGGKNLDGRKVLKFHFLEISN